MNQPTVCAVCLTADRPELAKRAVECFRQQTYPNKRLLVYDSGPLPHSYPEDGNGKELYIFRKTSPAGTRAETIGGLRNIANEFVHASGGMDVIVHWDDDDWSHPARIAEQVALLESSGAEAVGYNEMLFWRQSWREAWMYRGTILGTSLAYWRTTWERRQFEATSYGEDTKWLMGVKSEGVSSFPPTPHAWNEARMIARIHSSNTSKAYDVKSMLAAPNHWTRTPHWDAYCKGVCE